MILQLSETLEVPLRDRNDWLTSAGFAPLFQARALDDPQMSQVMWAVDMMLANHAPFPALAVDRNWNIRRTNAPFETLSALVADDAWARMGGDHRNLMRLFFHPAGIRPLVENWSQAAPLLWRRAQREAEALGGQELRAILEDLRGLQDPDVLRAGDQAPLLPIMPVLIRAGEARISLFTVISTFGTAQDVTADELRIETLFPADEATERLFRSAAAG